MTTRVVKASKLPCYADDVDDIGYGGDALVVCDIIYPNPPGPGARDEGEGE